MAIPPRRGIGRTLMRRGAPLKIHLESGIGQNLIRAYAPGRITINEEVYTTSLIVTPGQVVAAWPPASFADLLAGHFEMIAPLQPEGGILGTGARLRFPAPSATRSLVAAGIRGEVEGN